MKKFFVQARNRVLAGIIYMIPVFAVISILFKLFNGLKNSSGKLASTFGIDGLLGSSTVPVLTVLILICIFYVLGWLVRFSIMNRFKEWLEETLLQYIPGYLTYKSKMEEKIGLKEDDRKPVLVKTANGNRPGLMVKEMEDQAIVFVPSSPDTNNGEILLASKDELVMLNLQAKELIKAIQQPAQALLLERYLADKK